MRVALLVFAAMLPVVTAVAVAQGGDVSAIVAAEQKRVEASDFRGSGRLVRVDGNGTRVSSTVTIEGHWFPGVLRVLVELAPSGKVPGQPAGSIDNDGRTSILLEMRPSGQSTIRIFRLNAAEPTSLPFDKWGESVAGGAFSYEDFLQSEFYWQGQSLLPNAKVGARDCDVLKSVPGPRDHSRYAEVRTWLDHTIQYPVYVEKKPKNGKGLKEFTYLGLSKSGGIWTARQVEVKTQGQPGSTLLMIERGTTKANLTEKDFSVQQITKFETRP